MKFLKHIANACKKSGSVTTVYSFVGLGVGAMITMVGVVLDTITKGK